MVWVYCNNNTATLFGKHSYKGDACSGHICFVWDEMSSFYYFLVAYMLIISYKYVRSYISITTVYHVLCMYIIIILLNRKYFYNQSWRNIGSWFLQQPLSSPFQLLRLHDFLNQVLLQNLDSTLSQVLFY